MASLSRQPPEAHRTPNHVRRAGFPAGRIVTWGATLAIGSGDENVRPSARADGL